LLVAAGTRYRSKKNHEISGYERPKAAITGIGSACIEPFAEWRDITRLGHCNFQFDDNAAGGIISARRRC
jgi:hypothetical protein